MLEGKTLSLTGTDLEVEIGGAVELDAAGVDGEITVPARSWWTFVSLYQRFQYRIFSGLGQSDRKGWAKPIHAIDIAGADFPAVEAGEGRWRCLWSRHLSSS